MATENIFRFMSVARGQPNALVVLITSKKANLGMGWALLRGRPAGHRPIPPLRRREPPEPGHLGRDVLKQQPRIDPFAALNGPIRLGA